MPKIYDFILVFCFNLLQISSHYVKQLIKDMLKCSKILNYQLRLAKAVTGKRLIVMNSIIQLKSKGLMQRTFVSFFSNSVQNDQKKNIGSESKDSDIKNPKDHKTFLIQAISNGKIGNHQECISICMQILRNKPVRQVQLVCYLTIAISYKQREQFQTALEYLRKVEPEASKYQSLHSFYYEIANIMDIQRKFQQAIHYREIIYNLRSKDPMSICGLAHSYFAAQQYDKFQKLASKAVNQFPKDGNVLIIFAKLKSNIGKLNQAIQLLDKALQFHYNKNIIYACKLQALIFNQKFEQALKLFRKLSSQNPQIKNYEQFAYYGGIVLYQFQLFQQAIQALLKVTLSHSDFNFAQNVVGDCYVGLKKYEEAQSHYQNVVKLSRYQSPVFLSSVFVKIAKCQHAKQNREKAIQLYDKAITMHPNSDTAHIQKALLYHQMGKFKEAITHYKKVIELKPDQVGVWMNLGQCMLGTNKFAQAIDCYNKFLVAFPENNICLSSKIACLMHLHRYSEAKPILEKLIENFPTFDNYCNLGFCHKMFYDLDKAQFCLKKAMQIQPGRSQAINVILEDIKMLKNKEGS